MAVVNLSSRGLTVPVRVRAGIATATAIPLWGSVTIVAIATVIEQFGFAAAPGLGPFTDRIVLFFSFQSIFGVSGMVMTPVDVLLVVLLTVGICRGLRLPRSQLAAAVAVMGLLAGIAAARGFTGALSTAQSNAALLELRPWVYLGLAYLIASQAIRGHHALRTMLWTFVLGTGFKSLQGTLIYFEISSLRPRPDYILAHEESVLFGIFIAITLGLWLFGQKGRLRTTATALLPTVLLADLGNDRRTGILILVAELVIMGALSYAALPERRRLLRRIAAGIAVAFALYLPAFWNDTGTLGVVAEAWRSAIGQPNPRDLSSDQYRLAENANLGDMIKLNPIFGTGFGVPINYNSVPIADITNLDSMIVYVPHNGALSVWLRMGIPGEMALWGIVASSMWAGTRLSRSGDRDIAVLGAVVVCTTAGWVIMGYLDMGFDWLRVALAFGTLLGALQGVQHEAARREGSAAATRVQLSPWMAGTEATRPPRAAEPG